MNLTQQILNGLVLGSGYALIAIGWTVLLGAARLVNFAHGQLYMLGAFVAWLAMQKLGVSYFVAVPIAVLVLGLLGIVLQGMMLRLVMQQNLTSLMIVTLGFGYLIQGVAPALFGADPQAFKSPLASANLRFDEVILTFVVVVLGGIGSVGGSLLAGLGLGLFTALFGALVSPAYTTAAAFLVLLAVLVMRPRGLGAR